MNDDYQPLTDTDQRIFQLHSEGIENSIREAFPSIPTDFILKPVTIRRRGGCDIFYDFRFGLPDCQYVNVSFHTGGLQAPPKPGEQEPEQHYNVDPTLSSSQYE